MTVSTPAQKNRTTAIHLIALVIGMLMLSYASVPLYRLFCQITGFGGTAMRAAGTTGVIGTRLMTVDFNTDHDPSLAWDFEALQKNISLKPGEQKLVFFAATNHETQPVSGTSVFNVVPHKAGKYFMKTECFCYEEQRIEAGARATFPVSFFIDPDIENDPDLADVSTITLSYTFFKTKHPTK